MSQHVVTLCNNTINTNDEVMRSNGELYGQYELC